MPATRLVIECGFASETGHRDRNEDYCETIAPKTAAELRRGFVAAVADGIGGAPGGREAAEIAVKTFVRRYYAAPAELSIADAARGAVSHANSEILSKVLETPELDGMGTTLSVLVLHGEEAHTVHVGDSRIYRLRAGELTALTEDHNLGEQGMPYLLTRSLGTRESVGPDCGKDRAEAGDRYLLCTDGVTGALGDDEIAEILRRSGDPGRAAGAVVAAALAAGTSDNATAIIVDVAGAKP